MPVNVWMLVLLVVSTASFAAPQPNATDGLEGAMGPSAGAPVEVVDRLQHYPVAGRTAVELSRQMAALGPKQHGKQAWGLTEWVVRTAYDLTPTPHGCRLEGARVKIEITTTLPQWTSAQKAPWGLRVAWDRMMVNMTHHEDVHRSHGIDAATKVSEDLVALDATSDCRHAAREARRLLRRAVVDATRHSRNFDRETHFGARAGVHL